MKKVIFDLETTSAERDTCRIIQMAIKQIDETGKVLINKSKMYNPGVPITPAATDAHGITDDMVKDCPRFSEDAKKLKKVFEDAILIGYNIIVFDIPVLLNEFDRAGVELNLSKKVIDVMKLETAISPRTLGAVYERYTGKKLEGAHDAQADVDGTEVVLGFQMKKIKKEGLNEEELMEKVGIPKDAADFFGKLKYNEAGEMYFTFGKHKGLAVLLNNETKQYANWVISNAEFSSDIKNTLKKELLKATKKDFSHSTPTATIIPNKKVTGFGSFKQPDLFKEETPLNDDLPF